jgi:CRISPR/Cas system CSM-associated protein Csm3 (group 7 of RAMP superfamily)
LGGHGTRGSGRVSIENIQIKTYDCEIDEVLKNDVLGKLKEVESYGLLSV